MFFFFLLPTYLFMSGENIKEKLNPEKNSKQNLTGLLRGAWELGESGCYTSFCAVLYTHIAI